MSFAKSSGLNRETDCLLDIETSNWSGFIKLIFELLLFFVVGLYEANICFLNGDGISY